MTYGKLNISSSDGAIFVACAVMIENLKWSGQGRQNGDQNKKAWTCKR